MHDLVAIIGYLLLFVAVMFVLFIVLLLVVSKLPDDNPLKRILTALSYRVGATFGAGLVAIPIEPIPGIDVIYDVGVPTFLVYFWYTFIRDTYRAVQVSHSSSGSGRVIENRRR